MIGVLTNDGSNLGIPSSDLLQDGLKHVRLLLDQLTELLEVRVAAEELEAAKGFTTSSTCAGTCTCGTSTTGPTTLTTGLGSGFEKVERLLTTSGSGGTRRGGLFSCFLLLLLLLLLDVIRDSLWL